MLSSLNIFITDTKGDTVLALSEPITPERRTEGLIRLMNEPYLISRLIKDAQTAIELKKEIATPNMNYRYEWKGK